MIRTSMGTTTPPVASRVRRSGTRLAAALVARDLPGQRLPVLPIAFGPVRSRRLGWSLGINNVPPKTCTYSCVYWQVGATDRARLERETYSEPDARDYLARSGADWSVAQTLLESGRIVRVRHARRTYLRASR